MYGSSDNLVFMWSGSEAGLRGVYSWLILLKYSQIALEDSRAVRLSSTCWGSDEGGLGLVTRTGCQEQGGILFWLRDLRDVRHISPEIALIKI